MGGGQGAQGAVRVVAVLIKRRHINALNVHGCFQKLLLTLAALFAFFQQIQHRIGGLFPLAQEDDVRKLRHRLRVAGAGAAKGHNGGQRLSIHGTQRHPRQIQHIQNIGIRQLVLHGKADHIKVLDRIAAFQGKQRFAVGAHQRLHIVRRGKHPLAPSVLPRVGHAVKDFHSQVAHTDLISIRKTKGIAQRHFTFNFHYAVQFATGIARRFLHRLQQFFNLFSHTDLKFDSIKYRLIPRSDTPPPRYST